MSEFDLGFWCGVGDVFVTISFLVLFGVLNVELTVGK